MTSISCSTIAAYGQLWHITLPERANVFEDIRKFVGRIYKFVIRIWKEWSKILEQFPGIHIKVLAIFAPDSITTDGFRALQGFFEQRPPSTFADIFALAQLTLASSCILHFDDMTFDWDLLAKNFSQWDRHIQDEEHRILYQETLARIHSARGITPHVIGHGRDTSTSEIPPHSSDSNGRIYHESQSSPEGGGARRQCVELLNREHPPRATTRC